MHAYSEVQAQLRDGHPAMAVHTMLRGPLGLPHPAWAKSPLPQDQLSGPGSYMTAPMMPQGPLSKALRSPPPTPKQRADACSRTSTQGQRLLQQQAAALEQTPRVLFSVSDKRHLSSSSEHSEAIVWVETLRDQVDVVGGVDMEIEGVEWLKYIRHREDWKGIVGTGVVARESCYVSECDRRKCNRRTGIFVTRSDGSSVCMHPPKFSTPNVTRRMQWLHAPTKRPAVPARSS